jgi:hypothetical protein
LRPTRRAWRAGILSSVLPDHARLTIVFDLRADPIAGVVYGVGERGAFAGWMELTRTIERALDAARQLPGPDEPDLPRPSRLNDDDSLELETPP